ncbi:MAG: hypothetical protein AAFX99_12405, partial [Myxococcota bacterium]
MNTPVPLELWSRAVAAAHGDTVSPLVDLLRGAGIREPERSAAGVKASLAIASPDQVVPLLHESVDPSGALAAVAALQPGQMEALPANALPVLMRSGAQSAWLGRLAAQRSEVLELLASDMLRTKRDAHQLLDAARQCCADGATLEESLGRLRRWREAELARAFAREAWSLAQGSVTTSEVSALATACLHVVLELLIAQHPTEDRPIDAHGEPIPFAIIGLGKLGGWELNFGSDVDVVYLYGTDQGHIPSQGSQDRWAIHTYFVRLARALTQAMDASTPDGRLWRMDLRLRPDGNQGPLVQALPALESYYEAWGGTFERAVWLKARHIAGDAALGEALLARLRPFVYPRSLDFSALSGLREMKGRIDRYATSQSHRISARLVRRPSAQSLPAAWPTGASTLLGWDVKTGVGGIRAIEFTVQALQLVYGGRRPNVRSPTTLDALERLLASGLLPSRDVALLASAYSWYRLIEHRVQMDHNRHTHALPDKPEGMERLARRMGDTVVPFLTRLVQTRSTVESLFERLLAEPESAEPTWPDACMQLLEHPSPSMDDVELLETLRTMGFERPRQSLGQLMVLRSKRYSPFSLRTTERLAAYAPQLLSAVCQSADPDLALLHLASYVLSLGHHHAYYDALARNPAALTLLMNLFGTSRYLTRPFVRDPQWFDELLGQRSPVGDRRALEQALQRVLEGRAEPEQRLEVLRRSPTGDRWPSSSSNHCGSRTKGR